jgi:capsular exopolysaccharide synthesis family protein
MSTLDWTVGAGLTTALMAVADINDLLQHWGEDNLYVLAAGQIPPNPSELLGSQEMKELISRLEQVFDTVVIDAPPLLPVTDAAVLSQHVGGVIVVVGSQKIRHQDLDKSLAALEMVGSNVLGIVMNRIPPKGPDAYSYGYYGNNTSASFPRSAPETRPSVDRIRVSATQSEPLDRTAASDDDRPPRAFPMRRLDRQ